MPDAGEERSISELARHADVNIETIRYYERIGLLQQPRKPARGWRRYSQSALQRITFIKRAQHLGFSLAEIEELLGLRASNSPRTCDRVGKKAAAKLELIDAKLRDLQAMRSVLAELVSACPGEGTGERCPILRSLASLGVPRAGGES